jgi:hypothetical protein
VLPSYKVIPSTDAHGGGKLRQPAIAFSSEVDAGSREENASNQKARPQETVIMSKPAKTEAELIAMAKAELKVHADCPDGIVISVIRDGDSWEFRAEADAAVVARPGYPECVAMLVQIGDHLGKQFDVKG